MAYRKREPLLTLEGKTFDALRGPLVYLWKRGDIPLYVGKCKDGLKRISNWKSHHVFREVCDRYDSATDSFQFFGPFKTDRDAKDYEGDVIAWDGPYYNGWPAEWNYSGNSKPREWDYGPNKGYKCKRCGGWVRQIPYNVPDECGGRCDCDNQVCPPPNCPCRNERKERLAKSLVR